MCVRQELGMHWLHHCKVLPACRHQSAGQKAAVVDDGGDSAATTLQLRCFLVLGWLNGYLGAFGKQVKVRSLLGKVGFVEMWPPLKDEMRRP